MITSTAWRLDGILLGLLTELGTELERVEAGAYAVTLRGRRRPTTVVWLLAGEQAVAVEAFVMHVVPATPSQPGCTDPARLHRHLLARNLRLRGVHFAVDDVGDVFLRGSLPLTAVDVEGVDRVLGEVLQLLEDEQDALVAVTYGDALDRCPALAGKVLADGAGRRPAGTSPLAPRRDARR